MQPIVSRGKKGSVEFCDIFYKAISVAMIVLSAGNTTFLQVLHSGHSASDLSAQQNCNPEMENKRIVRNKCKVFF